ncbi:FAS-associated factor 2-like [Xenia sp. Carnegie-2017]|uniref:FAS-associated factor 2-like n=1 Tax=Xenia sp. Carnegie-2017 TaxID=2897299 RepID=UPI001F042108|nr:FAS-associated factor 2-like [Xenia sp. Carnegie-2017]
MAEDGTEVENGISTEEESILLEFQAITGWEDFERCRHLLALHQWNLQIAVQDAFNQAEGQPDIFNDIQEDPLSISDQEFENNEPPEPVTREPVPMEWSNWLLSMLTMPFSFTYSVMSDFYRFIVGLVGHALFGVDTTPLEDIMKFKNSFESKYGRVHPTFYEGSYSQVIEDAKKELRFLLVYLHSSEHNDTDQFCRSTLTNEAIRDYVNGNMLFWAVDVSSKEGCRVSRALRETTYPFMAVICLRDSRMMVVARLQGMMDVDNFIARLAQVMNDNEPSIIAARAERAERSFNQSLRAEQDAAYLESLRADEEKDRQKSLLAETKRLEEERKKDKQESIQNKIMEITRKRAELSSSLPPEPDSNDSNAICIVVRLPNGERMDRRFLKMDRLQTLYHYVFCNDQCPHDFKLVSNFPRKVLELGDNKDITLNDVGLTTSATLYVHDLTENSSDED